MKNLSGMIFLACLLSFALPQTVLAQLLPADRFLEGVAMRPAEDQIEVNQFLAVGHHLDIAPLGEIERVLASILEHTKSKYGLQVRTYAAGFLLGIALRSDTQDILAQRSTEIAALIMDSNPAIQQSAVQIASMLFSTPSTARQPYVTAFSAEIQNPKVPQEVRVNFTKPLLAYTANDPQARALVLGFMQQPDLTSETRIALLHALSDEDCEVAKALIKLLDDPDPRVRAAAVIAFPNDQSDYHRLAKSRVEAMAKDPNENPQVRQLAKDALSGISPLDPNIDVNPDKPKIP